MRCWSPRRSTPGSAGRSVREVHCWVEDIDLRLDPDPLDVVVEPIDDGYLVTVRARSLVKDLTLLVDRIDPAATVDRALVTLPAGASATVQVRTAVRGAERELAGTPVLRTANDLAAQRTSGDPVGALRRTACRSPGDAAGHLAIPHCLNPSSTILPVPILHCPRAALQEGFR